MDAIHTGRRHLADWQASRPQNYFSGNAVLAALAARHGASPEALARLDRYGAVMAQDVLDLVHRCGTEPNTPVLERFDAIGRRQERVRFDPSYHAWGDIIYGSGVMGLTGQPEHAIEQAALITLTAHHGEGGHTCPLACTAGLIRVLQRVGHPALQRALLPGLTAADPARRLHGSQFLTEVQGGSDVGANASRAVPVRAETAESPAVWRIHGEKWFCSVIDAPLYLMTARPEDAPPGTRGLGLFIVPHDLPGDDGARLDVTPLPQRFGFQPPATPNDFAIRRLKSKLGTRAMASGEVDWQGALAWQVGQIDRGFWQVVEIVLNTSRLFNALACAGSMFRAFHEAAGFARHRTAFGQPIARFAAVDQSLGQLYAEACAATASTFDLIALEASGEHPEALRLGLNLNKYWTSIRNTQMVRLAMEVLGGNGTIEDFSPLPRLFRDSMVTESWEGTHNVLAAQTLRDLQKLKLHEPFLERLAVRLLALGPVPHAAAMRQRLEECAREATRLAQATGEDAPIAVRAWMEAVMVTYQAVCLTELAAWQALQVSPPGVAGQAPLSADVVAQLLELHPIRPAVASRGWWPNS